MTRFILDASALGKRYVCEPGTPLVHYLFREVGVDRMSCLTMGALETFSIIVRSRNRGKLNPQEARDAEALLRREVVNGGVEKIHPLGSVVLDSAALITRHHVNSTDAVLLHVSLGLRDVLAADGNALVLVASDRRLLRAASAEALTTFDPENDDLARLQTLASS